MSEPGSVKLVGLSAENYRILKAVRLDLTDAENMIVVGGLNAQGKSTLLESIVVGLLGGKTIPPNPVRTGQERAVITERLSNGMVLERTIERDRTSSLKLRDAEGGAIARPQEVLDRLCGKHGGGAAIAFDPLEFARADEKEQVTILAKLCGIDLDLLARKKKALEEDRRLIGRERDRFKSVYSSLKFIPDAKPINTSQILEEMRAGRERAQMIRDRHRQRDEHAAHIERMKAQVAELQAAIASAETKLEKMDAWNAANPEPDLTALENRLSIAEDANAKCRQNEEFSAAAQKMDEATAEYDRLTNEIGAIDALRKRSVAEANLPVEGLDLDMDGVLYKGVPFKTQASRAEQIRVSVAIGMALNRELRLMLMQDGAFLDDASLSIVAQMAKDADYQLFVERPGDGPAYIVIEAGEEAPGGCG